MDGKDERKRKEEENLTISPSREKRRVTMVTAAEHHVMQRRERGSSRVGCLAPPADGRGGEGGEERERGNGCEKNKWFPEQAEDPKSQKPDHKGGSSHRASCSIGWVYFFTEIRLADESHDVKKPVKLIYTRHFYWM